MRPFDCRPCPDDPTNTNPNSLPSYDDDDDLTKITCFTLLSEEDFSFSRSRGLFKLNFDQEANSITATGPSSDTLSSLAPFRSIWFVQYKSTFLPSLYLQCTLISQRRNKPSTLILGYCYRHMNWPPFDIEIQSTQ